MSDALLRYKPSSDTWWVLGILGHLADVEIVYGYRLRQMLAANKLAPLDQDAWAGNLNYWDSSPSELVAFYGLARHHNLRLLRAAVGFRPFQVGLLPRIHQNFTVADLVERMGRHGTAYLQQIERLKTEASNL